MLELFAFGLSAMLAQVLTNLDNLAALLALMVVVGHRRAITGFLMAQFLVICVSALVAQGIEDVIPSWTGYLGLIPLSLGIIALIRQRLGRSDNTDPMLEDGASTIVVSMLFVSLSMDTFAVLAPLLADSTPVFRMAGIVGAGTAAVVMAFLAMLGARAPFMTNGLAQRLERLVPLVMILAGLYILSNSWTDAI